MKRENIVLVIIWLPVLFFMGLWAGSIIGDSFGIAEIKVTALDEVCKELNGPEYKFYDSRSGVDSNFVCEKIEPETIRKCIPEGKPILKEQLNEVCK